MGTYVSTFANGMAFMFFIGTALHLSLNGYKTRSNLFLEILFSLLAMLELKELIPAFSDLTANNSEISLFTDGLAVSACGLCLFELLRPGWNTINRVTCLTTAYVAISLLCITMPTETTRQTSLLFVYLYLAMVVSVTMLFFTSNKDYVSNTVFTTSRKKTVFLVILFAIYVSLWLAESLIPSSWLTLGSKVICITLWMLMIEERDRQTEAGVIYEEAGSDAGKLVIDVPQSEKRKNRETNGMKDEIDEMEVTKVIDEMEEIEKTEEVEDVVVEALNPEEQAFHFKKQLNKVMEDGLIYRNPRLTISEVANAVGTNRTYLSAYLNSVLHTSFYDYINSYRIENISKKLLEEESPGKTIEEIAELSGFNSTTTFRRAFQKKTGMTPMNYRREILSAN